MKRYIILLLMLLSILTLVGCGAKKKLEKKAGEALTEKIVKNAVGKDVDIDGDKVTIKGDDGEEMTFGSTEWPKSDLVKNIPKFENGTVISVFDTKDAVMIGLEKVKKDDFIKYLEKIKKDYTENSYEMDMEQNVTYGADNGDGIGIQLFYGDGTLSITVSQVQE